MTAAARSILRALGPASSAFDGPASPEAGSSPAQKWEASGAAALTASRAAPPGDVAGRMETAARVLHRFARGLDAPLSVAGAALLSERARLSGWTTPPPAGRTLRGAGILLRHPEGWAAYNIARDCDREALGALTGGRAAVGDPAALQEWAAQTARSEAHALATLLDIPAAAVGEGRGQGSATPFRLSEVTPTARRPLSAVRVADFSSLWAGPLAAALLASAGARVRRYEASDRREAPLPFDAAFAHRLNGGKELTVFDTRERAAIAAVLAESDVVVVSARPRALTSLGLTPRAGQIFVRITAHGATGPHSHRVGFGDDCAAAAGAVGWVSGAPVFAGDALADPATGLLAATAVLGLLHGGFSAVVDLDLRTSAQWLTEDVAPRP